MDSGREGGKESQTGIHSACGHHRFEALGLLVHILRRPPAILGYFGLSQLTQRYKLPSSLA